MVASPCWCWVARVGTLVRVGDDLREVYQTFDLALRVGEVVLSSGAAAADAAVSMMAITSAAGLREADISVTFTELSISWQPSPYSPPETHIRNVKFRGINYSKLTAVDHLVREIVSGKCPLEDARKTLDQIVSAPYPYPRWASTLGWGVMASGIGLLIGGDWLVMGAAFVAAVVIDLVNRRLTRQRIPTFYQQVLGGFLATMGAMGLSFLAPDSNVSQVVAAGIIVMLAGIAFVGAVQDAVTGYYITATARSFEALLLTSGIIGGVTAGLAVADRFGVALAVQPYQLRGFGYLPGCAVDQHFFRRQRTADMTGLMKLYPQLLGFGIDESTAIVVTGHVAERTYHDVCGDQDRRQAAQGAGRRRDRGREDRARG